MEKILTIIIPSFNVENTLRKTVESCLIPNMSIRELIEILIVNDGSTDETTKIAEDLEQTNPGIVKVWNKENGGHGSTINVGIDHCMGKYLKVVDGDDLLDTASLEEFVKKLMITDVDAVMTNYMHMYQTTNIIKKIRPSILPYDKKMFFANIKDDYNFPMASITVRTELLRNQSYRMDEHCFYVDVEYESLTALVVNTFIYLDMDLYIYRLEREGQSVSVQGWMRHYPNHETVGKKLIKWYKAFNYNCEEKRKFFENKIVAFNEYHYRIGFKIPKQERCIFVDALKQYDLWMRNAAPELYKTMNKDRIIALCRGSHFSKTAYSVLYHTKHILNYIKEKRKC